jgi:hypothetical protein
MVPRIHLLDLKTRHVSTLPGSEGLFFPRLSPDGRFLVAMIVDSLKLLLFNIMTQRWEELLQGRYVNNPTWSRTGEYLYFSNPEEPGTPFYRVRIADHKLERVATANLPRGLPFGISGRWTGLASDDSPFWSTTPASRRSTPSIGRNPRV